MFEPLEADARVIALEIVSLSSGDTRSSGGGSTGNSLSIRFCTVVGLFGIVCSGCFFLMAKAVLAFLRRLCINDS